METRREINITILYEVLFYLFLILEFWVYTIDNATIILNIRTVVLYILAIVGVFSYISNRGISSKLVAYIILMGISWAVCYIFSNSGEYFYGWDYMKYTLSYLGVASGFASQKMHKIPAMLMYYIVAISVFVRIVFLHENIRTFMLSESSYNFIPVIVMLYLMIYLIVLHQYGNNISLIATVLFFSVTIVSYGRSSIIAGAILLFLSLYQNYKDSVKKWHRWALICLTIVIVILGYLALTDSNILNSVLGKFVTRQLDNTDRIVIWGTYIQNCITNVRCFVFGGNAFSIRADGNLHNFVLQIHAAFGIVFLIVNIWVLIRFIIKSIKRRDVYLPCILVSFLFKASFDRLLFGGYMEIIYFYFIIYYFEYYTRSKYNLTIQ